MKIRSDSSLFEGRNFCYAVIDAAILGFVFDLVFVVFRYGTHACCSKIAKSANLIKFANSPRTPCIGELRRVSNLASNLTRKLAVQTPGSSSNLLKYQKRSFKCVSDYLKRRE